MAIDTVYELKITRADFKRAQELYLSTHPRNRIWVYLWHRILPVLGIAAFLLTLTVRALGKMGLFYELLPVGAVGLFWALWLSIAYKLKFDKMWKRVLADPKDDSFSSTIQYNDQQVISSKPKQSESRIYWSALKGMDEDAELALLYVTPKCFLILPKRDLSESVMSDLRARIPANVTGDKVDFIC